jgi:HlyD family secretion protein
MKRIISVAVVLGMVWLFGWTLLFLYNKSKAKPFVYETTAPLTTDIVKKTVATGAIVPRQEVELKPRVSGIIEELYVEPGNYVKTGQLVAKIQIVPDMLNLNRAESGLKAAQISFENATNELERARKLREQNIMPSAEFNRYELEFQLKQEELQAAADNLQLIKEGASRKSASSSNTLVKATVEGMVLDVPVKRGESVIESNNFNAGTTIALIADMNDMIFQGKVDESEVGKIKEGMSLVIKIGALEGVTFPGRLEYIAPKGLMEDGAIQFEIKAAIDTNRDVFIRANYSANADIVLERRDAVLAIPEAALQFDQGKPYVEVEVAPQRFERRAVEVGLSDGIHIEVTRGIDAGVKLKGNSQRDDAQPTGPRRRG